jgi:hypothetical protein
MAPSQREGACLPPLSLTYLITISAGRSHLGLRMGSHVLLP